MFPIVPEQQSTAYYKLNQQTEHAKLILAKSKSSSSINITDIKKKAKKNDLLKDPVSQPLRTDA